MTRRFGKRSRTGISVGACILVALVAVACSSSGSKSGGNTTGSSGSRSAAPVSSFPSYPAPAGGNGGATDNGVTATSIAMGSPIAASGALPGAQLGTYLGAKAYYAMVNASGGIYGRQLNLTRMETSFDSNVGLAICTKYIPQMFALNGTQSNVDSACFPQVKSTGIPWIGGWFDPEYYALPNAQNPLSTLPYGSTVSTSYELFKAEHPTISKVAIMWVNTAGIEGFVKSDVAGWNSVGVKVVYNYGVAPDVANLTPYIIQARNAGADVFDAFAVDITEASRMAQAMQQQAWSPTLRTNYAVYDAKWHTLAGAAGTGWEATPPYGSVAFLDSTAMNATPGGKLFEYWFKKDSPSQPIDTFAIEGWIQATYFVQGLINAGADLTRAKLLSGLAQIKDTDYGGLTGKFANPGKEASLCTIIMKATADGYVQSYPPSGIGCAGKVINYPIS